MIVIIGGMYRSGSTFTFNVVRELLQSDGTIETYAWLKTVDSATIYKQSVTKHVIIKTHEPDDLTYALIKLNAVKTICTLRKPEDAIASHRRVFSVPIEEAARLAKDWFAWYLPIKQNALNINYKTIDQYPLIAILKIQWFLFNKLNLNLAWRICKAYRKKNLKVKFDQLKLSDETWDAGFTYFDKTTFFHRKHISSIRSESARDLMSEDEIKIIRNMLSNVLDEDGNLALTDKHF